MANPTGPGKRKPGAKPKRNPNAGTPARQPMDINKRIHTAVRNLATDIKRTGGGSSQSEMRNQAQERGYLGMTNAQLIDTAEGMRHKPKPVKKMKASGGTTDRSEAVRRAWVTRRKNKGG